MPKDDQRAPRNVELLQIEIATIWGADARGRIGGPHYLAVGAAADGLVAAAASAVPDSLATELLRVVADDAATPTPGHPPASLARCRALLTSTLGDVAVSSGPSYLIPPELAIDVPATIVRSTDRDADLRAANPGNWEAAEWQGLLDGMLGPWAMALDGPRVVAICHTPAASESAVEAGVWTDPDFRGRGLAAAVTAEWAEVVRPTKKWIFYSTFADNLSSQRVAARLRLPLIGWLWKLTPVRDVR